MPIHRTSALFLACLVLAPADDARAQAATETGTSRLPDLASTTRSELPRTRQTGVITFDADGTPVTVRSYEPDSVVRDGYRISFEALDADGDGFIGRAEAAAHAMLDAEFRAVDADGDGRASRGELAGWIVRD